MPPGCHTPSGAPTQPANMPSGDVGRGEFGTYFVGYAASAAVTEQMLDNMFIGRLPGNTDRILDFSTALTGGLFFAPSADSLDGLPDAPGASRSAVTSVTVTQANSTGSLGIGSLKGQR